LLFFSRNSLGRPKLTSVGILKKEEHSAFDDYVAFQDAISNRPIRQDFRYPSEARTLSMRRCVVLVTEYRFRRIEWLHRHCHRVGMNAGAAQ
jgi:hypothetical protein